LSDSGMCGGTADKPVEKTALGDRGCNEVARWGALAGTGAFPRGRGRFYSQLDKAAQLAAANAR